MKMGAVLTGAAAKPAAAEDVPLSAAAATPVAVTAAQAVAAGQAVAVPQADDQQRNCCGCSARTGSIIIGTLDVVNGFVSLYFTLLHINYSHSMDMTTAANIVMILFGMLHILTGVGLIHGADKNRHGFIFIWLCTHYTELGLSLGFWLFSIGQMIYYEASWEAVLSVLAGFTVSIGVMVLCISIVRSLYRQVLSLRTAQALREAA